MKTPKIHQSIRRNIFFSLLAYTAITVALLWILQIMLLEPYYRMVKKNAVREAGETLLLEVDNPDFSHMVESECARMNMSAIVFGENGVELITSDMLGGRSYLTKERLSAVLEVVAPVLSGKQEYAMQEMKEFSQETMLIYAGRTNNSAGMPRVIILNAMIQPVKSTVEILKQQLLIVTTVLVVVSLLISQVVSARLIKPLQRITDQAKRLANGDYTADYKGDGIAEIEELARTLNFSADGLSHVEELRRELVANVSHDLKTPLTMIIAYAEMIRDLTGGNPEKRSEQLNVIIDEANRLAALVNDLIRVSRDEQQAAEVHIEPVDVSGLLQNLVERFSVTCPDYKFTCNCDEDSTIAADRQLTSQVLYNLVSNAVNYTGDDHRVMLSTERRGDILRVEVRDTGAGIPPEQLPLIWERYYRSRNTHKRPVAGSGLGLSIVRGALEKQKFKYGVDSTVGQGSCFWFEAPVTEPERKLLSE